MTLRTLAPLLLLAATGCYKTNFTTGLPTSAQPTSEVWHHRVLNGIVEIPEKVQTGDDCSGKVARIHTEVSALNGLVEYGIGIFLTPILYNPSTVQVWCASGSAAKLTVREDGLVDLAPIAD